MHWLRRHIIVQLTLAPTRRYAELKPKGVETNLFTYHLRKLVSEGYLERVARGEYRLATKGKRFAGYINVDTGRPRPQPKIVVMLVAKNKRGEHLLFRWKRQPFYGLTSLPYGKTDFGKSVYQNAREELRKKSNLRGSFKHLGDVYVLTREAGEPLNHMLVHVLRVTSWLGQTKSLVRSGQAFWDRLPEMTREQLTPGTLEILELVHRHKNKTFFEEIEVET